MRRRHLNLLSATFVLVTIMNLPAEEQPQNDASPDEDIVTTDFDSIQLYTLRNANGVTVKVTNYGAIITSILVPDRNGHFADIALGYDDVAGYMNAVDKP